MKRLRFIKTKIRLIYASPLTYLLMFLQVSFLVIYIYAYKITTFSGYFALLKKDLFLWIICIPVMVVQHKVSIYSTYYSCVSRICGKHRMIFVDYVTLAISTCISTCIVLSVPTIFLLGQNLTRSCMSLVKEAALVSQEVVITFFFLLARYILLSLLVQYIIYAIMYALPNLQKKGGSICALPFLLYFVLTSPMEFLRAKGQYNILILDFSAGGYYVFDMSGVALWSRIFFYNIHLVGYIVFCIWITIVCLSKKWEFLENESVSTL